MKPAKLNAHTGSGPKEPPPPIPYCQSEGPFLMGLILMFRGWECSLSSYYDITELFYVFRDWASLPSGIKEFFSASSFKKSKN